jgi:hypothetical protein
MYVYVYGIPSLTEVRNRPTTSHDKRCISVDEAEAVSFKVPQAGHTITLDKDAYTVTRIKPWQHVHLGLRLG